MFNSISFYGMNRSVGPLAIGGTITDIEVSGENYRVHKFTESGDFQVLASSLSVDYLIVAGGGGGGAANAYSAGGGGGGGVTFSTDQIISQNTYPIIVGLGGIGGGDNADNRNLKQAGFNGLTSSFNSINAIGGGGGGGRTANDNGHPLWLGEAPKEGGSGGGGGGQIFSTGNERTYPGAASIYTLGEKGGDGLFNNTDASLQSSGGGGGASAVGQNGLTTKSGDGGQGYTSNITGSNQVYGSGGGGGKRTGGSAGTGGNNAGNGQLASGAAPTAGSDGFGGGGGGAGSNSSLDFEDGAKGGSGIVIIRYKV